MAVNKILVKESAYKVQPVGVRGRTIAISPMTQAQVGDEYYEYYYPATGIIELIPKEMHDAKAKD